MTTPDEFKQVLRDWSATFMHKSMHDFIQFRKDSGLSMTQINTLFHLYHGSHCGVSDVGELLGVTNAAASQMIDKMVHSGLIARSEDPIDRRMKQLKLTSKGRQVVQESIDIRRRWMEQLTDALTQNDQVLIITALTILTSAAKNLSPEIYQNEINEREDILMKR